jgi:hypothetical protein
MGKICTLAIILLSFATCRAQILNIEQFRTTKDTANVWAGNIGLGFSTKKQQTSVTTLNANSNVVYLSKKNGYLSINYIKFIGILQNKAISEGYTHLRFKLMRRKILSYEPFLKLQYDLGRGLLKRELYGFTFRLNLLSNKKFLIGFNTGAMYEHEIWKGSVLRFAKPGKEGYAETMFIKSTNNISLRGELTKNLSLFFVTYYQARFERFFFPRIISDLQLNLKISKYLTLSNQFVSTFDALPILSNNNFIYSLNTSLMVKF